MRLSFTISVGQQNVQYVPLCVFRLILQSRKQSQYQTMESRNQFLTKWQVVLFTDVQESWSHRHRGITNQGEKAAAVY